MSISKILAIVVFSTVIFINSCTTGMGGHRKSSVTIDFKDGISKSDFRNYDFFASKPLIVIGTLAKEEDEDDYETNKIMAETVKFRMEKWLNKAGRVGEIIEDSDLTTKMIQERDLVLIGTPKSNSILRKIESVLPIKVSGENIIIAGGEKIEKDESGVSFKYPNPLNPKRMIWVVTAPLYENIRFVPKEQFDYVIYKVQDYNLKSDRIRELAQGKFNDKWQLEKVDYVDNKAVETGENDQIVIDLDLKEYPAPQWAKKGVMYEIFVRSFYDSDGDGIGDLAGITEKLDYLNDGDPTTNSDLGIDVIWLMPIFDSPSYHGYDVRDYMKINPQYGTNEDFQTLLKEAHRRGIKIVTDLILNHCSNQHKFYKNAFNNPDSKYDKWFFFTNQSNTRAHNWEFRHRKKERDMYNPYMPAWNLNNPETRTYLFEMAKYWIDPNGDGDFSDGVDGFRCDYAKGPSHEFWKLFRAEVKGINPEVLLLAEVWEGFSEIATYFDNEFDMAFDFAFQGSLSGALSSGSSQELINYFNSYKRELPKEALMNRFLNNHDMNRIYSRMDQDRAKLGITTLLTLPQMPMIYYGDEIGMKGVKDPYDEGVRRPFEWYANNKGKGMTGWYPVFDREVDGVSVEEEQGVKGSLMEHFSKVIRIRNKFSALQGGAFEPVSVMDKSQKRYGRVLAYTVTDAENTILVVTNLHDDVDIYLDLAAVGIEIKDTYREELSGKTISLQKLAGKDTPLFGFQCQGLTSYIFKIK